MHNVKTNLDKILEQIKPFAIKMVNSQRNVPRCGVIPKFSDLEVVALSMTAEALSIDSENLLFQKIKEYKSDFPNIISRCHYNQRRKYLTELTNAIRHNIAMEIGGVIHTVTFSPVSHYLTLKKHE